MNEKIISNYRTLIETHGNSARAVQWRDKSSQENRFKLLADISPELTSVLDLGSGLAHFYTYLRNRGFSGKYLGLELVEEFVKESESMLTNDSSAHVKCFDVTRERLPVGYDYGFISGMFNNTRDDSNEFIYTTLRKLWSVCNQGIAFNVLSKYVDYFDGELNYVDPMEVFTFLKCELNGHVSMWHDYVTHAGGFPCEVTFHVRKTPRLVELSQPRIVT